MATQNPDGTWALSDADCTDVAVASGWIPDTPAARAEYLARGDDDPVEEPAPPVHNPTPSPDPAAVEPSDTVYVSRDLTDADCAEMVLAGAVRALEYVVIALPRLASLLVQAAADLPEQWRPDLLDMSGWLMDAEQRCHDLTQDIRTTPSQPPAAAQRAMSHTVDDLEPDQVHPDPGYGQEWGGCRLVTVHGEPVIRVAGGVDDLTPVEARRLAAELLSAAGRAATYSETA